MSQSDEWRYLHGGGGSGWPRRHIFLDCEARSLRDRRGWTQTWRLGVVIHRHAPKRGKATEDTTIYLDADQMWRDVTSSIPRGKRAVLWSHNLGYDLRISRALTILPKLGWRVTAHNISAAGAWIVWRRAEQSLTMVDSASHFPSSIAQASKSFGAAKAPLPADSAPDEEWTRRCVRDVEILRDLVVAYLDKLESLDLGGWQMTGTGQAWAAFRAHHVIHRMLIHWDRDARAAERRAMWTGRCEALWRGRLSGIRVDEWDMALAYPRVAASESVPVRLLTTITSGEDLTRWLARDGHALLADVDVTTSEPLVPCARDGRICWPVGRFRTTLWDPEIRLLIDRGQSVDLIRGWTYVAEPALASMARWMLDQLAAPESVSPAWWCTIVKHWSRAWIGRMAMTHREWEPVGRLRHADVRRASYVDVDTGATGEMVQVGHDAWVSTETVDWSSSMPQLTSWIQSAVRERLTRMMLDIGERKIIYVDTDSMLTTAEHHDDMLALCARWPGADMRLKRSWRGATILGPRQIVTGPRVRVAGVPVRAQRLADGSFAGEVWQSLSGAMAAGRPTAVRIDARRWRLRGVDHRRDPGPDGWTVPIRVDMPT